MISPKHVLRYLKYKKLFAHADLGWQVWISKGSTINNGVKVGPGTSVNTSYLGNDVVIGSGAAIIKSHLGDNTTVRRSCEISNSWFEKQITVGDSSYIADCEMGAFSYVSQRASLGHTTVGKFCSIASDVIIGPGNHPTQFISTSPIFYSEEAQCGVTFAKECYFKDKSQVSIGHDVWIGAKAFVRDGVTIGDGAVIGAGAVVVKDVDPYAIVVGVPAKLIKYRFNEATTKQLLELRWWDLPEEKLRRLQLSFVSDDIRSVIEEIERARCENNS